MATKTKKDWKKAAGLPPDYPLSRRTDGRWCKKIRGRIVYFVGTADEALAEWGRTKADHLAGRTPPAKASGAVTVEYVINRFLAAKEKLVEDGELAPRSLQRYLMTGRKIAESMGRNLLAGELTKKDVGPTAFEKLRADLKAGLGDPKPGRKKGLGPVALANEIGIARSIFKFADEMGLIDRVVRFGPGFKKPSRKKLLQERARNGVKRFSREQILALLKVAGPMMKGMVLLGINCGFGNGDCSALPISALNLEGGWLNFPRPKTGIDRRVPLWPETVEAIKAAIAARPEAKDPADSGCVFIDPRGRNYLGAHRGDRVVAEFNQLMVTAGVEGRSFYDLRRTFQIEAEGSPDFVDFIGIKSIMGHASDANDMSSVYRQGVVKDARLLAVVGVVRKWLWPESA